MDAWRTQQSCSASRHATLFSHLYTDREPAHEFLEQSPRRCTGPALRPDQRNRRQTDKLQILSWNPGPARSSHPSLLASHPNEPWHVIIVQEGSGFVTDSSLEENFQAITQHHCAVLLNKDTFAREFTCTPIQVPCSLRLSSWAVEDMVVTGMFRRAPHESCSYFTVANIHINNECAKRRSVCIALLLLIRDLCLKLGVVVLTGDFTKAVERETPSSDGDRRTSPPGAAFSHANTPWPTFGIGITWPDCCGFVSCPSYRVSGLLYAMDPAAIGLGATDQTWHQEHWVHLKFAGRKRSVVLELLRKLPVVHLRWRWRVSTCSGRAEKLCLLLWLACSAPFFCHPRVTQQGVHCPCHFLC